MLSEAETYPDWTPQAAGDDHAPIASEPRAPEATSAWTDGWGIANEAPVLPTASAWAGFSEPVATTDQGPSFWASPSNTPTSIPSWNVAHDDPAPPASSAPRGWAAAQLEGTESESEPARETDTTDEAVALDKAVAMDEASALDEVVALTDAVALDEAVAMDEVAALDEGITIDEVVALDEVAAVEVRTVCESPFHEVAAKFAADNPVPVAEREVDVPAAGRWDESPESAQSSESAAPDDELMQVAAPADVVVPIETNRRSRLPGRRKLDRAAEPDALAQIDLVEPAAMVSLDELEELDVRDTVPVPKRQKTPKPPKVAKTPAARPVLTESPDVPESDKAARAGFFTKKVPSTAGEAKRDTPMVLRIAALASLLIGVGLFGYTVINGRRSTPTVPTAPAVTVAPPAPAATLAPAVSTDGAPVSVPAEDPIFGDAPAVPNDGLAFDTTANFDS